MDFAYRLRPRRLKLRMTRRFSGEALASDGSWSAGTVRQDQGVFPLLLRLGRGLLGAGAAGVCAARLTTSPACMSRWNSAGSLTRRCRPGALRADRRSSRLAERDPGPSHPHPLLPDGRTGAQAHLHLHLAARRQGLARRPARGRGDRELKPGGAIGLELSCGRDELEGLRPLAGPADAELGNAGQLVYVCSANRADRFPLAPGRATGPPFS